MKKPSGLLLAALCVTSSTALAGAADVQVAGIQGPGPVRDLTPYVLDVIKDRRGLAMEMDWSAPDAPDRRDIEEALNARPTLSGPETLLESDAFLLHYTTEGDDAVTDALAQAAFESIALVWEREIGELGYPAPPSDGVRGGDGRYDFYFTQQRLTYGVCYGETNTDSNSMTSYIALGSWMNEAETQVTVAHEFFHAIHYTMDALEETWWFEVTATWMEDQVYDDINDYYNYVPQTMSHPEDSLRDTEDMYANAIWGHSLSEAFGRDIIQDIWLLASESDGKGALASNRAVLEDGYGADYEAVLHGWRESFVDTGRFEEGAAYGAVTPTATATFPVWDTTGSITGTGANVIYIPGDGGSSATTLSVVLSGSNTLVGSLLVESGGAFVELASDTAPGEAASWTVPGFGTSWDGAWVVITNVGDTTSDSYTLHVEAPGWSQGGGGGCDTQGGSGRGALAGILGLALAALGLRRR